MFKQIFKLLLFPYWVLCLVLNHSPLPPEAVPRPGVDKIYHFFGYAILAFLFQAYLEGKNRSARERFRLSFMILIGYGFLDEVTQPFFSRAFDLFDLSADGLGIILGSLLFLKIFPSKSADQSLPRQ